MKGSKKTNRRWIRKALDGLFGPTLNYRRIVAGLVGIGALYVCVVVLMRADSAPDRGEEQADSEQVVGDHRTSNDQVQSESSLGDSASSHGRETRKGDEPRTVAVLVANYGYRRLALNTICALRRVGIEEHVLFSLDKLMHEYATERMVNSVLLMHASGGTPGDDTEEAAVFGSRSFVRISLTKTGAVLALLRKGVNVLFVDLDLHFLRNPVPVLLESPEEIVATSDIMYGRDAENVVNLRLNSGLFLARPKPEVQEAFEEMARIGLRSGRSQQKSFNWVLCGQYAGEPKGPGALVGDDRCKWRGRNGTVTTRVLPLREFPNGSGWSTDEAVSVHYNFVKGVDAKTAAVVDAGGWYFKEDATVGEICG